LSKNFSSIKFAMLSLSIYCFNQSFREPPKIEMTEYGIIATYGNAQSQTP